MSKESQPASQSNDQVALTAWCVAYVAEMLEVAPNAVKPNAKFSRIGLDSAMSVQLAVALEERLGVALSPDVIADHPTISQLVSHLSTMRSNSAP
ncbi:MAG: acyl carrier protein [Xanthobacteraceae bacterium]